MVRIREDYRAYTPPGWVRRTVERLLGSLSEQHFAGLATIILTDSTAIGGGKTKRVGGRKYERRDCRGFYHARQPNEPAWIEVVIDNVVQVLPMPFNKIQLARDLILAETLFHEIGHHLHSTIGSAARSHEAAAEDWCQRLTRLHFRKRYWYLLPLLSLARGVLTVGQTAAHFFKSWTAFRSAR
jgi:hypothetical protein